MFAVLEVEEHKKGLFKSFHRFFEKDDIAINYHTIKGAVPFITIGMTAGKNGIDWDEVRNAAGVCAERLLLSKDIQIPDGYGVVRFKPSVYNSIPIFNSMLKAIETVDPRGREFNITVLDRTGALSGRIDKLLKKARYVTVFTDNVSDYKLASKRTMDRFGAAIAIYDYDHREISDSVVFADRFDERLNNCPVVFCAEENDEKVNVVSGSEITAEHDVVEKKPACVETFDFVAALYELNNLKRAEEYSYNKLKLAGEEITFEKAGMMIEKTI